jgi:hypothetical protein
MTGFLALQWLLGHLRTALTPLAVPEGLKIIASVGLRAFGPCTVDAGRPLIRPVLVRLQYAFTLGEEFHSGCSCFTLPHQLIGHVGPFF